MSDPTPIRPQLDLEILGAVKFKMIMHINGGSKYSTMSFGNEEWGLQIVEMTDGSPNYKTTAKEMQDVRKGAKAVADLMTDDHEELENRMQAFCDEYNRWAP